jgi:hypothetical protein
MAFLEAIFGGRDEQHADAVSEDLKKPDPNEATDLGLHVRQCAKRYGVLADGLNKATRVQIAMQRGIARTQLLLLVVILLLLMNKTFTLGELLKLL